LEFIKDIIRYRMHKTWKVIIVDDHNHFRDGLKYVLNQTDNINVIAEASDGLEFLRLIEITMPDVVLMDISMPRMNGIEATQIATEKHSNLGIIALTMFDDDKYCSKMLNAGVKGFVLKESGSEELIKAITCVAEGRSYFTNDILSKMIRSYSGVEKNNKSQEKPGILLSEFERQILKLICAGLSNKEISGNLTISQKKVKETRLDLQTKTNTNNSSSLAIFTIKNKLLYE
jgi:DNA-binding NarL/FixJ family response regulator